MVSVTSILPTTAREGETVTITGTGFSTTPSNNDVTINGISVTVLTATAIQLEVTVPYFEENAEIEFHDWKDITQPVSSYPSMVNFDDNKLRTSIEYDDNSITISGDLLQVKVSAFDAMPTGQASEYHFRSEFHRTPWQNQPPVTTEEWANFNYIFSNDYVANTLHSVAIHQCYNGADGVQPLWQIDLARADVHGGGNAGGNIEFWNECSQSGIVTSIIPTARQRVEFIVHVVYGEGAAGLIQVWVDGTLIYNETENTVLAPDIFGGNMKWGVYHYNWNQNSQNVVDSIGIGAGELKFKMEKIRYLTRTSGNPKYKDQDFAITNEANVGVFTVDVAGDVDTSDNFILDLSSETVLLYRILPGNRRGVLPF